MTNTPFFPIEHTSSPATVAPTPVPAGPLDPEVVYRQTRPSDWLKMPEVSKTPGNLYALVLVPQGCEVMIAFDIRVDYGRIEYGVTDTSGVFRCTRVASESIRGAYSDILDASDWGNTTSDGFNQCIIHISYEPDANPRIITTKPDGSGTTWCSPIREIACNVCYFETYTSIYRPLKLMRYFAGYGFIAGQNFFNGCQSLVAVRNLDVSSQMDLNSLFYGCSSLRAIPELDTSSTQSMERMFYGCSALDEIPELDTSSATSMSYMFYNCFSLKKIPSMNTSHVTNFTGAFWGCRNLIKLPNLDLSSGTKFDTMFTDCSSLTEIPEFNTSNAQSMENMFSGCKALTTVPVLNTSKAKKLSMYKDTGLCSLLNHDVRSLTYELSFEGMNALSRLTLVTTGWPGTNIKLTGTCLSREAMIEFFNSLPTVTVTKIITLGYVRSFNDTLTEEDKDISRTKGWTIQ